MLGRRMKVSALFAAVTVTVGAWPCSGADALRSKLPFATRDTILAVRVKNINRLVQGFTSVVTAIDPAGAAMVTRMVGAGLGQLPGIDMNAPAAILILDPRRFEDPVVGVFTLTDPNLFRGGVKGAQTAVAGKLGVVSDKAGPVEAVVQAINDARLGAIPTRDMTEMVVVSADVGGLLKRYGLEIRGALQLARLKLAGPGGQPPADPIKQMALRALGHAAELIAQTEKQAGVAEFGVSLSGKAITGSLSAEATPGSAFATYLSRNNIPVNRTLPRYLLKDAILSVIASSEPASRTDLTLGMIRVMCDILGLGAGETQALCRALDEFHRNLSGLHATAVVPVKDEMAGVELHGIKESGRARASVKAICQVTMAPDSVIGGRLKQFGLAMSLAERHRTYKGVPIDKMEYSIEFDKLVAALPIPADAKRGLVDALKAAAKHRKKYVLEVAYGTKLLVVADITTSNEVMNKQIDLMKGGGLDGIARLPEYSAALDRQPKDAVAFWHVSLYGYSDAIGKMMAKQAGAAGARGGMNFFPTRAELPAKDTPISGSVQVERNRITLKAHVPVEPVAAFAQVIKRKFEAAMKEMMAPGAAPPMPMP